MKRGEDEVAGVGGAHGGGKTDGVAHFSDHDDVGVLSQDVFEAGGEGKRVQPDFSLFDDGFIVLENEFDGVFQSDDVTGEFGVDLLDHGGQRRRFAASGGSGDEDNASGLHSEVFQLRQQSQLFKTGDVGFDIAHGEAKAAFLLEKVCAETSQSLCVIGKVNLSFFFESFGQVLGNNVPKDFVHPLGGGLGRFDGDELSVDSDDDRRVNFDVDVRSSAVDGGFQYAGKDFHWKTFWNGRRAS